VADVICRLFVSLFLIEIYDLVQYMYIYIIT
jgi:hypothetical protein